MSTKYELNKKKVLETILRIYKENVLYYLETGERFNGISYWATKKIAQKADLSIYYTAQVVKELQSLGIFKRVILGGGGYGGGGYGENGMGEDAWYSSPPMKRWELKDITLVEKLLEKLNNT